MSEQQYLEPCACGGAYDAWKVGALREHRATARHQRYEERKLRQAPRRPPPAPTPAVPEVLGVTHRPCPGPGCLTEIPLDRALCHFCARTQPLRG